MRSLQFFKMPDIWDCMADWMLMILNLYYRMFQIKSVIPVNIITLLLLVHAKHISGTGININTVALWIVFCKYCSHRIPSPYDSINH